MNKEVEKLVDKVARIIQNRDEEVGECSTRWEDGHESTQDYYRKTAKKVLPTIREEVAEEIDLLNTIIAGKETAINDLNTLHDMWKNEALSLRNIVDKSEEVAEEIKRELGSLVFGGYGGQWGEIGLDEWQAYWKGTGVE